VAGSAQFTGTAPTEAVWVSREGVATRVDSGWGFVPARNGGLALSPDGRRLALALRSSGSEDIRIKELDRGPLTRLTLEGSGDRPEWTADGRSVMYISTKASGNADVRIRRADGTGSEATLLDATRAVLEVVRTPDTARFIVRLGQSPTRDIMLMVRGDSTTTPLVVSGGFEEVAPALSPSGRWLAYASNESGRYEVYVRPYPDVNAGHWQVSRNGGNEPGWAHSGRELFYRDSSGAMVAALVTPGAAFVLGEQRTLFPATDMLRSSSHRTWDVSPDDRRFVFTRLIGTQGAPSAVPVAVIQVDDWLAEIQNAGRKRP
jgi:serine/threonine-protein kinase